MTPEEVLDRIQWELTVVMGPLAPVIMRHKCAEFGVNAHGFPQERMAELVEEVSFEIQNRRKKVQFQRAALNLLRELPQRPAVPKEEKSRETKPEAKVKTGRKSRLRLAEEPRPEDER